MIKGSGVGIVTTQLHVSLRCTALIFMSVVKNFRDRSDLFFWLGTMFVGIDRGRRLRMKPSFVDSVRTCTIQTNSLIMQMGRFFPSSNMVIERQRGWQGGGGLP